MSTLTKKSILNKMSICQNNINSPAHKTCYSAALKHWITATEKKRGIFLSEQIARMNFYHNFILVLKTLRPKVIIRRRRGSGVNGTVISSTIFFWSKLTFWSKLASMSMSWHICQIKHFRQNLYLLSKLIVSSKRCFWHINRGYW